MKPEIKRKWLEALRSGQYKQTSGCLTDGERFCCLGVLTNLYLLEVGEEWRQDKTGDIGVLEGGEVRGGYLSERVYLWAGLSLHDVIAGRRSLSEANDSGTAFPEIADLIEKHL